MKNIALIVAVLATFAIASCGGGSSSGGDTPTPTTDNTKATSEASVAATNATTTAVTINAMGGIDITPSVSNSLTAKENIADNINYTHNCSEGGTVVATGTMTASCTGDGSWSCSNIAIDLALQFNDCTETATVDSVEYTETLNGTATSTASGTAAGNDSGLTSLDVSAVASGTLDATGDATGTVTLDLDVAISGAPVPDATCSGTATVVTDTLTETCTVTSDCSGCEA